MTPPSWREYELAVLGYTLVVPALTWAPWGRAGRRGRWALLAGLCAAAFATHAVRVRRAAWAPAASRPLMAVWAGAWAYASASASAATRGSPPPWERTVLAGTLMLAVQLIWHADAEAAAAAAPRPRTDAADGAAAPGWVDPRIDLPITALLALLLGADGALWRDPLMLPLLVDLAYHVGEPWWEAAASPPPGGGGAPTTSTRSARRAAASADDSPGAHGSRSARTSA